MLLTYINYGGLVRDLSVILCRLRDVDLKKKNPKENKTKPFHNNVYGMKVIKWTEKEFKKMHW